jgi:hypothetical protein
MDGEKTGHGLLASVVKLGSKNTEILSSLAARLLPLRRKIFKERGDDEQQRARAPERFFYKFLN